MIRDGENGIVSFRRRQIDDEIQGDYTEGYKGMSGRDREQGDPWFGRASLGRLTDGTPLDIVPYKSLSSGHQYLRDTSEIVHSIPGWPAVACLWCAAVRQQWSSGASPTAS